MRSPLVVAERALARLRQLLGGVHDVDGALLKLHGIASGRDRGFDQSPGQIEIAVVVDADFGDDKHRVLRSDASGADRTAFMDREYNVSNAGPRSSGVCQRMTDPSGTIPIVAPNPLC